MVTINEDRPIRAVLEQADKVFKLANGYHGVIVETTSGDPWIQPHTFAGTLVYFPGVRSHEVMKGDE